jgi:branched-chain amino acid transport system ATP-binding protein
MADCPTLRCVFAGCGETNVLEDISLELADSRTLAVLGRNGVGKTTLLATEIGHTTLHHGTITFRSDPIERLRVPANTPRGSAMCCRSTRYPRC